MLQPRVPHVRGEGVAGVVPVGVVEGGHHHQLDHQLGREQLGAGPQQLAQQAQLQQLQEAGHRGLGGEGSPVGAAPVLQDTAAEYLAHLVMVTTLVTPDTDNIFVLVSHLYSHSSSMEASASTVHGTPRKPVRPIVSSKIMYNFFSIYILYFDWMEFHNRK